MTYEEILSNEKLREQYNLDPYFHTSVNAYLSGADPVIIISDLSKRLKDITDDLTKYINKHGTTK